MAEEQKKDFEMTVNCPDCGRVFVVRVPVDMLPKQKGKKRAVSEEERQARAERMRSMRLNGIGGRPKGIKETRHRSTFGMSRKGAGDA